MRGESLSCSHQPVLAERRRSANATAGTSTGHTASLCIRQDWRSLVRIAGGGAALERPPVQRLRAVPRHLQAVAAVSADSIRFEQAFSDDGASRIAEESGRSGGGLPAFGPGGHPFSM